MPECKICKRDYEEGEFCEYHEIANKNIKANYDYWNKAYGGITFEEYLKRISEHKSSGKWVREVARFLLKKE